MPNLKDLRDRKKSVESTRKITSAMKMVSAAKLRRAQEQAVSARPYAAAMAQVLSKLTQDATALDQAPKLLAGTGRDQVVLFVIMTSDRGLCGGFNSYLVREAKQAIQVAQADGKTVKIVCVGRKGRDLLKYDFADNIVACLEDLGKPRPKFEDAETIKRYLLDEFEAGQFDRCVLVFSQFKSAMTQVPKVMPLIPFQVEVAKAAVGGPAAQYIYEPDESTLLEVLLPKNLAVQLYGALLETFASEQGARMTAMDSATRNAGDMIRRLDLTYNRARQAYITKELIEIISGAEAL